MKEIIIKNSSEVNKIKAEMAQYGIERFHVLSDFDKTLTKAVVNGEEVPSLISILRSEGYLTADYPAKAQAFYEHYRPIEIDSHLSFDEKKKAMEEWWTKHFELLVASRLNRKDVERAMHSEKIQLRDGAADFLKYLAAKKIPLIILSSSGLGKEAISSFLNNQNLLTENIFIISNEFEWDEEGYARGVKQPIIHSMNKDETTLSQFPFYEKIQDRKNVLLLGDSPEDANMIRGFDFNNVLKICFLNSRAEENLRRCEENYDVVIPEENMEYVNKLLKEMFT